MPSVSIVGREKEEALRRGTRQQYESGWAKIPSTGTATFRHELGEIPWLCDVLQSEQADGRAPVASAATATKDATSIVVTNSTGAERYFHVRAL